MGALIRQSGWPVELTAGGFTAPFGPPDGGPPPWQLYRFVFHTAIGQGEAAPPAGASRANRSTPVRRQRPPRRLSDLGIISAWRMLQREQALNACSLCRS